MTHHGETQMTISSLAPGRLMLTLFLAAQRRRAARTAIIIRASQPATEPVYNAGQSQIYTRAFYALVVTIINMLFGQVEEEATEPVDQDDETGFKLESVHHLVVVVVELHNRDLL